MSANNSHLIFFFLVQDFVLKEKPKQQHHKTTINHENRSDDNDDANDADDADDADDNANYQNKKQDKRPRGELIQF